MDGIANQSGVRTINCSGLLNLCQTAALLRRSALFIGNDSGLSHIAAAMKTPLIQLFGPGEPEKFGYTGPGRIIIQRRIVPITLASSETASSQVLVHEQDRRGGRPGGGPASSQGERHNLRR